MQSPSIIPALHQRQQQRGGYLTDADMKSIAEETGVPLHRVNAVASFFPHFRTDPPPKVEVHICRDMSCHLAGSVPMIKRIADWAEDKYGNDVEVCGVSCLGRCDRAPAAIINEQLFLGREEADLKNSINGWLAMGTIMPDTDWDIARNKVGAWDMDVYDGAGRYESVQRYVKENMQPKNVLDALQEANLLGMGGAGGRAYMKWGDVLDATGTTGEKFIVCNADESEPGTFKDREILLAAPYLTIEGMILAALVVGATRGWIYIRHEYPEQIDACRREIARAVQLKACGRRIFGSNQSFELEVYTSPGGYICGEQTALIEAMEDKRAEPRNRPPELMTNGLYDQPTLLSNVETFAWVPAIMRDNAAWFAAQGIKDGPLAGDNAKLIKGKRLFSISGDLEQPGVYEVPTGITLGELIDNYCQGMRGGRKLIAVALSGPSGGLLPAKIPIEHLNKRFVESALPKGVTEIDIRDLPLDINISRAVGYMLGAGIVVYGEGADLLAEVLANSRFYANESCGKCVPCRIGSHKITEMAARMKAGDVSPQEFESLQPMALQLAEVMEATSICGLGQVASKPLQTFLKFFPDLARAACRGGRSGVR